MKTMPILAGLIILSVMSLALVATVAATSYTVVLDITFNGNGAKGISDWHIDTTTDGWNGPFSGSNVVTSTIVATYYDVKLVAHTVVPYSIVLAENSIDLYFTGKDLPSKATAANVVGSLTNGDTFFASGPGWTWNRVH
jgi:hypothetical protein